MATTTDMDMTAGQFVQFTLAMGCDKKRNFPSKVAPLAMVGDEEVGPVQSLPNHSQRDNSILIQYSTNGGISWQLLKVRTRGNYRIDVAH